MKKTSIILTAYIQSKFQAHMTMACIGNVLRYTNPDEYELILMSDSEKWPVRDDYHNFKIDQYVKTTNLSYTQAMNKGAALAAYDYLVFLQNDVFVPPNWLSNLRWYLDEDIADCVVPDQMPRPYAFVQQAKKMSMTEAIKYGSRDEGLVMITKSAFEKAGKWNEDLTLLCGRDFWERLGKAHIRQVDTCKVMITHIMAATNIERYEKNQKEYDAMMAHDNTLLNT